MRILYGAFAQGHGHFSKASVLVPLLEARGHDVRVISSGNLQPPPGYRFRWHRHFPALSYVVSGGQTDYRKTLVKWIGEIPSVVSHLLRLRRLVREFQPELIISDFEPLTAGPMLDAGCEVIALSRQAALLDPSIPLPEELAWERKMTRSAIRMFTAGASRLYGYHYCPASFRCVPPVVRAELLAARPETGEHLFVYNQCPASDNGSAESLVEWARRRRTDVRAYGFSRLPAGRRGRVDFRPSCRSGMLDDMRTARAVIVGAGLTTPVEAFLLRKPVCVVPIAGHWEQTVNAYHLEQLGLARRLRSWDYDQVLDTPPPGPCHPLADWLRTPAERILDHVMEAASASRRDTAGQNAPLMRAA